MKILFVLAFTSFFLIPSCVSAQQQNIWHLSGPTENNLRASGLEFLEDSIGGKLTVSIRNPQRRKFWIFLYKDGMKYYYRVRSVNYRRTFNFTKAEAGNYLLTVSDGERHARKNITVVAANPR